MVFSPKNSRLPDWDKGGTRLQGRSGPDPTSCPPDADYISAEELAQVEQMLAHLTSASAQAAAASLVSRSAAHPQTAASSPS